MPRKRTAADAELPVEAPASPCERTAAPVLPADVLQLIFALAGRGQPAVFEKRHRNKMHAYCILRLVCKQWALLVGRLVRKLRAPRYNPGPIALPAAFPRVTHISTGALGAVDPRLQALVESVLADYAAHSIRVCVKDNRPWERKPRFPLNVDGHFGKSFFWEEGVCNFSGAALPVSAWVTKRDRTRVFASLIAHIDNWSVVGDVLAHADTVELHTLRKPITGSGFRASALAFDLSLHFQGSLAVRYPPENVRALLDPARWVGGRLPSLHVFAPVVPIFSTLASGVADVNYILRAIAPIPAAVYADGEAPYAGCGFVVLNFSAFHKEFQ